MNISKPDTLKKSQTFSFEQFSTATIDRSCSLKPKMFPYFMLIEGIDGSGKDTFADLLALEICKRFSYDAWATLSIIGQPCFRYEKDDTIRRFIEAGECSLNCEAMLKALARNRRLHEHYLKQYGGFIICIRGLLTDLGTIERLYGRTVENSLGQSRLIDQLVVVDVDPDKALHRIHTRGIPPTWRETPENLCFFRDFFRKHCYTSKFPKSRLVENNHQEQLLQAANEIADELLLKANAIGQ
jgi:thymidylate kinase